MTQSCSNYDIQFECRYDPLQNTLNDVPIWKLFIDKDCHSLGKMAFDISSKSEKTPPEPGYYAAMQAAFDYTLKNLHKKLDAEEFKKIHLLCIANVENLKSNEKDFKPSTYSFIYKNVSSDASFEWKNEKLIVLINDLFKGTAKSEDYLATALYSDGYKISSNYVNATQEIIAQKINDIFATFYTEIENAADKEAKLLAIVAACRKLEIGHFFSDGNQRTIVFVILNKLLLENNFLPVILEDPLVFDGYHSKRELLKDISQGMANFLSTMQNENKAQNITSNNIADNNENFDDQPFFACNKNETRDITSNNNANNNENFDRRFFACNKDETKSKSKTNRDSDSDEQVIKKRKT